MCIVNYAFDYSVVDILVFIKKCCTGRASSYLLKTIRYSLFVSCVSVRFFNKRLPWVLECYAQQHLPCEARERLQWVQRLLIAHHLYLADYLESLKVSIEGKTLFYICGLGMIVTVSAEAADCSPSLPG
jgi:hypothetical protein